MRSILVVDDNEDCLLLSRLVLEHEGYGVTIARNAEDALIQMAVAIPDLVLVDLMLPKMDGLELIAKVRDNPGWNAVKILALSALDGAQRVARATGCDNFLLKPVEPEDLSSVVKELLA